MHYYPAGWCFVRVMEMSVCLIQNLFSYVVARPDDIDLDQVTPLHFCFCYSFRFIIIYI